ncbi:hypothetical protein HK096_007546 [Nowakowskiella sp. JEL0078]|nr:hypothetical protein HK096_007546 [Nowakowskiella sp. JEL0078]
MPAYNGIPVSSLNKRLTISISIIVLFAFTALVYFQYYDYSDAVNFKFNWKSAPNIDQIHKKTAKLLYGPIVAHEDSVEKHLKIPIEVMWEGLYIHGLEILEKSWENGDYAEAGSQIRTFSQLYTLLNDRRELQPLLRSLPNYSKIKDLVEKLERKIYPWINHKFHSLKNIRKSWRGRGLILTTGHKHFHYALHAIITLRKVMKFKLPIEVFYNGEDDIKDYMKEILDRIPEVSVIDISKYFNTPMEGWHSKPFAMLASSFAEVILIDADVLFLQNPNVMFDFNGYRETGTVFFHDRTIVNVNMPNGLKWFKTWMKDPTEVGRNTRFWKHISDHEMESGAVVYDKRRTYLALLAACWMNAKGNREIALQDIWGDKEMFWMTAEMIRVPYFFVPVYGGTIGYLDSDSYVCGGLYHGDEKEQPLWWNNGVLINKAYHMDRFLNFTHHTIDHTGNVTWKWEDENNPYCLMPQNPDKEIRELSLSEKMKAEKLVELFKLVYQVGVVENDWNKVLKKVGY